MQTEIMFCVVMVLTIYGVACLLHRLSLHILKPHEQPLCFEVAYLRENTENVEQIVRYFRMKADKGAVLLLVDNGLSDEQKQVVGQLCKYKRDVRFLTMENFVEENCNCGVDGI